MRTLTREERERCDRIAVEVERIAMPIALYLLAWLWLRRDESADDTARGRSW